MEKTNSFNEEEMQVCQQLGVNDINELDDELRSYVRALTHVKEVAEKGAEEDFVTKEQLEMDLREALTEAFHAKREGRKLKSADKGLRLFALKKYKSAFICVFCVFCVP